LSQAGSDPGHSAGVQRGSRIQDSGFRIQDSGFRIQDSGFRIQDSGFGIQGSGFWVWGLGIGGEGRSRMAMLGKGYGYPIIDADQPGLHTAI
jgi:hypothetical protein